MPQLTAFVTVRSATLTKPTHRQTIWQLMAEETETDGSHVAKEYSTRLQ